MILAILHIRFSAFLFSCCLSELPHILESSSFNASTLSIQTDRPLELCSSLPPFATLSFHTLCYYSSLPCHFYNFSLPKCHVTSNVRHITEVCKCKHLSPVIQQYQHENIYHSKLRFCRQILAAPQGHY